MQSEEQITKFTSESTEKEEAKKSAKKKKTPKQRFKKFLKVLLIIVIIIAILCGMCAVVSLIGIASNRNFISTIEAVEYDSQLTPEIDENGYYTFVTDEEFKIVQLSDIHIGAGFLSIKKDSMAINAVAAMIKEEKPDLVIVTGDIAYPVPFQAGTFNNKTSAAMFATLMEQLGVYWCVAFGNHDTEAYSYYSREDISDLYESDEYPHCLFQAGDEDVDGYGNYVVNIKNTSGEITQSLFMLDTHSYTDNDYFGTMWKYDTIHANQVEWYEQEVNTLTEINGGVTPKSLAFFHMPIPEYKIAYDEYKDNGYSDTENVQYIYGKAGEQDIVVYSSNYNYGFFDKVKELGSTQGLFCGHDHMNNFSLEYEGIRLSYSYTVDYLAYVGVMKYGVQRGCTVINVSPNGSFDCHLENYYQDKYQGEKEKEDVSMVDYYEARQAD